MKTTIAFLIMVILGSTFATAQSDKLNPVNPDAETSRGGELLRIDSIIRMDSFVRNDSIHPPATSVGKITKNGPAITVYPNPASDHIFISGLKTMFTDVAIYDMLGKVVVNSPAHDLSQPVDISALPEGVYFVHVKGSPTRRIAKTQRPAR